MQSDDYVSIDEVRMYEFPGNTMMALQSIERMLRQNIHFYPKAKERLTAYDIAQEFIFDVQLPKKVASSICEFLICDCISYFFSANVPTAPQPLADVRRKLFLTIFGGGQLTPKKRAMLIRLFALGLSNANAPLLDAAAHLLNEKMKESANAYAQFEVGAVWRALANETTAFSPQSWSMLAQLPECSTEFTFVFTIGVLAQFSRILVRRGVPPQKQKPARNDASEWSAWRSFVEEESDESPLLSQVKVTGTDYCVTLCPYQLLLTIRSWLTDANASERRNAVHAMFEPQFAAQSNLHAIQSAALSELVRISLCTLPLLNVCRGILNANSASTFSVTPRIVVDRFTENDASLRDLIADIHVALCTVLSRGVPAAALQPAWFDIRVCVRELGDLISFAAHVRVPLNCLQSELDASLTRLGQLAQLAKASGMLQPNSDLRTIFSELPPNRLLQIVAS